MTASSVAQSLASIKKYGIPRSAVRRAKAARDKPSRLAAFPAPRRPRRKSSMTSASRAATSGDTCSPSSAATRSSSSSTVRFGGAIPASVAPSRREKRQASHGELLTVQARHLPNACHLSLASSQSAPEMRLNSHSRSASARACSPVRIMLMRGRGVSAANRARNSIGSNTRCVVPSDHRRRSVSLACPSLVTESRSCATSGRSA